MLQAFVHLERYFDPRVTIRRYTYFRTIYQSCNRIIDNPVKIVTRPELSVDRVATARTILDGADYTCWQNE
jgi:hypothetical protein